MKAIRILTMAALAASVFASCSNEDELALGNYPADNVVRIMTSVDGMNTRASYGNSTDNLSSFGFCINNANSTTYTYDNIKVTKDGSNWNPAILMLWQNANTPVDILAYAPFQEREDENGKVKVFGNNAYAFAVKADQSDANDYSSDFIVYRQKDFTPGTELNTNKAVDITFAHILSQLNLTIELRDEFNQNKEKPITAESVTDVKINGTIISSKVDFTAESIIAKVDNTQGATTITPEVVKFNGADEKTAHPTFNYSAIVIPQSVTSGKFSIGFKVNGNSYVWTATENDVEFLSGKSHQLHLLVGKDVVQISYIGVSPWREEHTDNLETE